MSTPTPRTPRVSRWITTSAASTGGVPRRRAYNVDGETLRGSGRPGAQHHLLAVLDQPTGVVLGQVDVDGKTSEITRFARRCSPAGSSRPRFPMTQAPQWDALPTCCDETLCRVTAGPAFCQSPIIGPAGRPKSSAPDCA
jgi:hypothetical protein